MTDDCKIWSLCEKCISCGASDQCISCLLTINPCRGTSSTSNAQFPSLISTPQRCLSRSCNNLYTPTSLCLDAIHNPSGQIWQSCFWKSIWIRYATWSRRRSRKEISTATYVYQRSSQCFNSTAKARSHSQVSSWSPTGKHSALPISLIISEWLGHALLCFTGAIWSLTSCKLYFHLYDI